MPPSIVNPTPGPVVRLHGTAGGAVLPVVLVLLTVLTGLVLAQLTRTGVDERLAANLRESVALDNAAQTTLRWCEWHVIAQPGRTALVAGTATTPAWRVAANWNDDTSIRFVDTGLVPDLRDEPRCVVEDATCELQPPISPTGMDAAGCNGIDSRWRKFRVTARVRVHAPDLSAGVRESLAQSELRLFVD
jgi:hypothetical protein